MENIHKHANMKAQGIFFTCEKGLTVSAMKQ